MHPTDDDFRKGDRLVTALTEAHLTELHKLADALGNLLPDQDGHRGSR